MLIIKLLDEAVQQAKELELAKEKYQKLTEKPQWVFPDPDLKGVTDAD